MLSLRWVRSELECVDLLKMGLIVQYIRIPITLIGTRNIPFKTHSAVYISLVCFPFLVVEDMEYMAFSLTVLSIRLYIDQLLLIYFLLENRDRCRT